MNGYYSGVGTNLKFRLILKDKVHAIQTFYVGADYIYTLQRRRNQSDGELRDLAFSRLKIKKDRHGHPTGKYSASMKTGKEIFLVNAITIVIHHLYIGKRYKKSTLSWPNVMGSARVC